MNGKIISKKKNKKKHPPQKKTKGLKRSGSSKICMYVYMYMHGGSFIDYFYVVIHSGYLLAYVKRKHFNIMRDIPPLYCPPDQIAFFFVCLVQMSVLIFIPEKASFLFISIETISECKYCPLLYEQRNQG